MQKTRVRDPNASHSTPAQCYQDFAILPANLLAPPGHCWPKVNLRSLAHPIFLHTATSQSARPGLLGDIFAVPQQAHGFPFLTASHISSSSPQTPPARGGSLCPLSSRKLADAGSGKACNSSLRSPASCHQPLCTLNTTQRHPGTAHFPASLAELLFSFPSASLTLSHSKSFTTKSSSTRFQVSDARLAWCDLPLANP